MIRDLIKDKRIGDILIHYFRNVLVDLREKDPDRFGDIHNDFNDFEAGLCSVCPFHYDTHTKNCLECCPVSRTKEQILMEREKEDPGHRCSFQPIEDDRTFKRKYIGGCLYCDSEDVEIVEEDPLKYRCNECDLVFQWEVDEDGR